MGLFDALYEYDEEKHLRTIRKEGFEEGFEKGREEVRDLILNKLIADGTITPEEAEKYRNYVSNRV